jgi:hypothetical protein
MVVRRSESGDTLLKELAAIALVSALRIHGQRYCDTSRTTTEPYDADWYISALANQECLGCVGQRAIKPADMIGPANLLLREEHRSG